MSKAANRPDRSQKKRTPIGTRNVLTAPERDGYKRRFVNDKDNSIQRYLDAGYTIVENTSIGEDSANEASQLGSAARKPVGGGMNAVLMEIRKDWYQEDQDAKEARLKQNEQGLLNDQNGNSPDMTNLYGEGVKIQSNRPIIQAN